MYERRLKRCTSAAPLSSATAAASNADEPAPMTPTTLPRHRCERNVARRVRPQLCGQRANELGHVRPAGARVAVREHDLARGLDAPRAVLLEMQAQHVALRLDLEEPRAVAHVRARRLLKPVEVVGPGQARNSIERVERGRTVQRFVPGAKGERRRCRAPVPPSSSACAVDACARSCARCRPRPARLDR